MAGEWRMYTNSRGCKVKYYEGKHVSLSELKMIPGLDNYYLRKVDVPYYPEPVVFYVPNVMHVTDERGLRGIFQDGGFRIQQYEIKDNYLWFSLSVAEKDIATAEKNFLQIYPYGWNQKQCFLKNFTTSPAFQSESRYGNFCFTLSIRELLRRYATQFCYNTAPVFRELNTKIYKQEIMYTVLVHPKYIDCYEQYRRLPRGDEDVCGYFQGYMSWRCQAPSGTLPVYGRRHKGNDFHYMWDHVTLAFHMEPGWVLRVNRARLYNSVTVCEVSKKNILRDRDAALSADKAKKILEDLGREYGLV